MFLLHGDAKYIDVLERVIYNGFLSGVSLEGDRFFYPNPLETAPRVNMAARAPWFDCACCPSNVVRFIPSIPGYVYAQRGDDVYVNLFVGGSGELQLEQQRRVGLTQETRYPWDGAVKITRRAREGRGSSPCASASPAGRGTGPCRATSIATRTPRAMARADVRVNGQA